MLNYATIGGVLSSDSSTITIEASEFYSNSAESGGVLYSYSSNITIEARLVTFMIIVS